MIPDSRTPYQVCANGMKVWPTIFSTTPRDRTALPSHSAASCRALRRRQETTRPSTASRDSTRPNVSTPSRTGPW